MAHFSSKIQQSTGFCSQTEKQNNIKKQIKKNICTRF